MAADPQGLLFVIFQGAMMLFIMGIWMVVIRMVIRMVQLSCCILDSIVSLVVLFMRPLRQIMCLVVFFLYKTGDNLDSLMARFNRLFHLDLSDPEKSQLIGLAVQCILIRVIQSWWFAFFAPIAGYHGTPAFTYGSVSTLWANIRGINAEGLRESSGGMLGSGVYCTTDKDKAQAIGGSAIYVFHSWPIGWFPSFWDPFPFWNFGMSFFDLVPEGVVVLPDGASDSLGLWRWAGFRACYRPHESRENYDEFCVKKTSCCPQSIRSACSVDTSRAVYQFLAFCHGPRDFLPYSLWLVLRSSGLYSFRFCVYMWLVTFGPCKTSDYPLCLCLPSSEMMQRSNGQAAV